MCSRSRDSAASIPAPCSQHFSGLGQGVVDAAESGFQFERLAVQAVE